MGIAEWRGACTTRGMADDVEVKATVKAGVPVLPLVMSVVVAVTVAVAGVGGAAYWLAKSGRLPVVQGAARVVPVEVKPVKLRLLAMEPLLVNLADDGGRSYLRVAVTLRVEDAPPVAGEKVKEPEKGKPVNENEAALRDAALGVLGHETAAALLAPDGKDELKKEFKAAMAEHVPEVKVVDVLFTEFLVQR